jgi:hypothetical protein
MLEVVAHHQGTRAHDAGELRRKDDAHGDHRIGESDAQRAGHGDGQHDRRKRQQGVDQAPDHLVEAPSQVAGS